MGNETEAEVGGQNQERLDRRDPELCQAQDHPLHLHTNKHQHT